MDNPRPEKVAVVEEVRSRLDQADAVIVTEYRGLKVKDLAALRRSLVPLGGEYRVFKNTLVRIAATEVGAEHFADLLTGPTALAFVRGDAAAVTKTLRDFARANPLLHIKGGLLGRSVLGPDATLALADLPSREQLLARLAGGLAAPMQNLAGLLAALPRNFAYGLAALRDKRAADEPVAEQPAAAAEEPAPAAVAVEAEEPAPAAAAEEPAPAAVTAEAEEPAPAAAAEEPAPAAVAAEAEEPAPAAAAEEPAPAAVAVEAEEPAPAAAAEEPAPAAVAAEAEEPAPAAAAEEPAATDEAEEPAATEEEATTEEA